MENNLQNLSLKECPPSAVIEGEPASRASQPHAARQTRMAASQDEMHGQCFGFEMERATWTSPLLTSHSAAEARPGYNSMSKSEARSFSNTSLVRYRRNIPYECFSAACCAQFHDDETTLQAKVRQLARLICQARRTVVFAGAGLSTAAGIVDYASPPPQNAFKEGLAAALAAALAAKEGTGGFRSSLCAQPTLSHRVLAALHKAGHLHRLIQQNHDGLPQKAGLPQQALNEIHGACHAPDNPVVPMSGSLLVESGAEVGPSFEDTTAPHLPP